VCHPHAHIAQCAGVVHHHGRVVCTAVIMARYEFLQFKIEFTQIRIAQFGEIA
jgi:hypothetical protein